MMCLFIKLWNFLGKAKHTSDNLHVGGGAVYKADFYII